MSIEAGHTTYWQAKRGIVQSGLVLSLDAAVDASYISGTTWYDLSGVGNNGTLTNGPTFNRDNGGSIEFDGSDDRVLINASSGINLSDILSAFIWVKFDAFNTVLMGHISYFTGGYLFHLDDNFEHWSGGKLYTSVASAYDSTAISLNTSDWFLLTLVRNGTAASWYLDGTLLNTGTIGSGDHILSSIGAYYGGGTPLNGKIASVQIYNRALTGTEVLKNYNATKGRFK